MLSLQHYDHGQKSKFVTLPGLHLVTNPIPRKEPAMKNTKVLITAGSTVIPIDQVRAITNIFKGRTGTAIAEYFADQGYDVTLLTSSPALVTRPDRMHVIRFRTFDDLEQVMEQQLTTETYDLVIHSAAVSDYRVSRVLLPPDENGQMKTVGQGEKISSKHQNLLLELTPTPKLIDRIRTDWGYHGYLVKFKLEVGKTDRELLDIAQKSLRQSNANLIVANCLEWSKSHAYVVDAYDEASKVNRGAIAAAIERSFKCILYAA